MRHETIEKSPNLMMILIVIAISIGGLVEIIPLMASSDATEPDEGIAPYSALRLAGRDIYVREGCYNCHSQMIRPFRSETERYGPYTTAGETVYDRPFQFGSKRTGPDLARVGGRYSDDWQPAASAGPARTRSRIEYAGVSLACRNTRGPGTRHSQDDDASLPG